MSQDNNVYRKIRHSVYSSLEEDRLRETKNPFKWIGRKCSAHFFSGTSRFLHLLQNACTPSTTTAPFIELRKNISQILGEWSMQLALLASKTETVSTEHLHINPTTENHRILEHPLIRAKIHHLSLLPNTDLTKEEIEALVVDIEKNKDEFIKQIKNDPEHRSIYVRRNDDVKRPRSYMVAREGSHYEIYISLKRKDIIDNLPNTLLGQGRIKRVTKSISYNSETVVAEARIRGGWKELKEAWEEFRLLQDAGLGFAFCRFSAKNVWAKEQERISFTLFLASEGNLTNFLNDPDKWKSLPIEEKRNIVYGILHLLNHFHEAGIALCDFNPNNILVHKKRDGHYAILITDLGAARKEAEEIDQFTAYYAPPEVNGTEKVLGRPVDIYSLGCMLWQLTEQSSDIDKEKPLLSTLPPWVRDSIDNEKDPIPSMDSYLDQYKKHQSYASDETLRGIIYRMTAPRPEKRPTIDQLVTPIENHFKEVR